MGTADVKVIGGFPRSIFGKFTALCAYVRMCIAAAYIALYTKPDVVVCDLVSGPCEFVIVGLDKGTPPDSVR